MNKKEISEFFQFLFVMALVIASVSIIYHTVIIPTIVENTIQSQEFCNCTCEETIEMLPLYYVLDENTTIYTLNLEGEWEKSTVMP